VPFIREQNIGGSGDLGGDIYKNGKFIGYSLRFWEEVPFGGRDPAKN